MSFWDSVVDIAGDVVGSFAGDPALGNQVDMGYHLINGDSGGAAPPTTGAAAGGAAAATARQQGLTNVLTANQQNISGQSNFQQQQAQQRQSALRALALQSAVQNPRVSPFDPAGAPTFSPQFTSTLDTLGQQGTALLATPPVAPSYTPLPTNASQLGKVTGTNPSTLQTIATGLNAFTGSRPNTRPNTTPGWNGNPGAPATPPGGNIIPGGSGFDPSIDPSTGLPWDFSSMGDLTDVGSGGLFD